MLAMMLFSPDSRFVLTAGVCDRNKTVQKTILVTTVQDQTACASRMSMKRREYIQRDAHPDCRVINGFY
jgi:hypothetical protein